MSNQNILDSNYTKVLYIKLEELRDHLLRLNAFLSKKTDLETMSNGITDKIAEVKSQVDAIKTDTSATFTITNLTNTKVDTLSDTINAITDSITGIDKSLTDLNQAHSTTSASVQDLKTLIPSAKDELLAEFPKVKDDIDKALDDLVLDVTNQYKVLITLVSDAENTVRLKSDEIQSILGDVQKSIDTLANAESTNIDYELIKSNIYDVLLPKFTELSSLISGLNIEVNTADISTAVKESLAEDFSTVNANIDALSTQISSGSSAIEIDTSHLNSLIESLEFVASKRKYYEPLPENYEVADASTYTVTSIQDTMKGEFIAGSETIPTYSLPFVYFTAQVGCLYCLEINNTMYSYKKDTKTIKVYLNGELVKTLTVPTASDSYSSSQLANITYGFLATQEYNELKLEYISNTNNSFIPKLVSVTLHGPNGKINSCIPKFKVERVFDNYYIYKRDNISYLSFITPIDNPEILPNSSQSFITNGYTQIGATMNKPASSDGVLVGIYDMYANAKNIAVGKVNGSETGTNSAHTYIYAIMMGFQYESNTMLFCFALNSANTLLQGNVSNSNAPTFYSVKHPVEGKIVKLTQICELTNVPFTYMRMVGVTLDNNDNYLLYQKSGSTYKSLYIGKGDRWNMGIVAKNLNGTNVRLILRSYMYRNNQWLREEFLIYNTGTTMTVTKLDSYLLEGNYDFVYCGANNDFFSQTNGDFSLNKHLPVDYTEQITF